MANLFFIIAHFFAIIFGVFWLIFTIPFHLFYLNSKKSKKELKKQTKIMEQQAKENKRVLASSIKCPFCAELIKKEAIVCKHCGKDLLNSEKSIKEIK